MSVYKFTPFQIKLIKPSNFDDIKKDASKGKHLPLPRSGHRMICIDSDLYVFGGYNQYIEQDEYDDEAWIENCPLFKELWKFNTISKTWSRLKNLNGMPGEIASHSAVPFGPYMIVYGGTASPFGEASSNSVHLCHLAKGKWLKLNTTGDHFPPPMYGQAVCREESIIYVVGGTTGFQYSIDVHVLNLKTNVWEQIVPNLSKQQHMPPNRRYRHEIVVYKGWIIVFGGGTGDKAFHLDELPAFNLEERVWTYIHTYPDSAQGEFPKPRKCHVLIKYKTDVYIQGGTNEVEHLKDFWKLNLETMTWRKLKGTTRKPIYFHSGAVTEEGAIYLFGGIWDAETTRTNKVFRVYVDVPSLRTMAWEAVNFYAPNLIRLPRCKLLEMGIPPLLVDSVKSVPEDR